MLSPTQLVHYHAVCNAQNLKIFLKQVAELEISLVAIINHALTSRTVGEFVSPVVAMRLICYFVYSPFPSQIVTVKAILPLNLLDSQFIPMRGSHTALEVP